MKLFLLISNLFWVSSAVLAYSDPWERAHSFLKVLSEDWCGAGTPIQGELGSARDFDQDGIADILIHIDKLSCHSSIDNVGVSQALGLCGANTCTDFLFLSSRADLGPLEFFADGTAWSPATDAQTKLYIWGQYELCEINGGSPNCTLGATWGRGEIDYVLIADQHVDPADLGVSDQ